MFFSLSVVQCSLALLRFELDMDVRRVASTAVVTVGQGWQPSTATAAFSGDGTAAVFVRRCGGGDIGGLCAGVGRGGPRLAVGW